MDNSFMEDILKPVISFMQIKTPGHSARSFIAYKKSVVGYLCSIVLYVFPNPLSGFDVIRKSFNWDNGRADHCKYS